MPQSNNLLQIARDYSKLTQELAEQNATSSSEHVLNCLVTRDEIAYLLHQKGPPEQEAALLIAQGDDQLRQVKEPVSRMEGLQGWRQTFSPPLEAWWWHFEPLPPTGFFYRFDWLWVALALIFLTLAVSLIADIAPRFLSGGPDTWGAFVVIIQSVLALLTTRSILTTTGQNTIKRVLRSTNFIPERMWEEAGLVMAVLLFGALLIFRLSLPQIAVKYNNRGFDRYQAGLLTSARFDYERALKLNPDLVQTHYNLGLLYEDLNDLDQARAEYQIALQGALNQADVAYNNLGRLYILDEAYDTAVPFLLRGLAIVQDNEVRYDLRKNLGWARLGQKRFDEAQLELETAINLMDAKAPAHCLLAQVLSELESEPPEVEAEWTACLRYADSSRPDEDTWIGMARAYFRQKEESKGEE